MVSQQDPIRILIIGAGGHGQCVADNLLAICEHGRPETPIGFVDDNVALHGQCIFDLPVLGGIDQILHIPHDALFVGIGSSRIRRALYTRLLTEGERFARAVHPNAQIMRGVEISDGVYIGALATVSVASRIGSNTILNGTSVVGHHVDIGEHVHIAPGVTIAGEVTIGSGSMIGIGANILPRVRIGQNCIVGAATLVRQDVPNDSVIVGVPGRILTKNQTP
jgi:sugar O-acyltransferase (sialic acid O-acetyltransferase NeuD family)